ncbi:cytochrome P450 [Mycobacterium sp. 3519A]|uniref:cytochrome P450 n=1 Tax=Mycobacterium sp. 3519A TaxID=2057184 RepID=UPI000C7DCE95|nr:cytochrome P450 [Mycobacterium sp. 3519A]
MNETTVDEAAELLANPKAYLDEESLNNGFARLRQHAPVVRVERAPYRTFWGVTKHADIVAIEQNPALWINGSRPMLCPAELDDELAELRKSGEGIRNLVHMDGDEHRAMRAIGTAWFGPKALRVLDARVSELAARYVDLMAQSGPELDFVDDVATAYAGHVILSLLGLPESDFPLLISWTQEIFGLDDDERRRGQNASDALDVVNDFIEYFRDVTADRRAHPTDDLASAIANAQIDGRLLPDMETISYYGVIASAGHDSTKAAIAGGLLALIENPVEMQRLRADPTMMPTAVEEMLRWTTPVKAFMRTAKADTSVRDVPIARGESVYLAYQSGNRDEDAFDNPMRFDVGRRPNKHLGLGVGVHYCLGAALARTEIAHFFTQLIPRIRKVELAGDYRYVPTTFVGGLSRLPIRYEMC